jgi:hypothetical protein
MKLVAFAGALPATEYVPPGPILRRILKPSSVVELSLQ